MRLSSARRRGSGRRPRVPVRIVRGRAQLRAHETVARRRRAALPLRAVCRSGDGTARRRTPAGRARTAGRSPRSQPSLAGRRLPRDPYGPQLPPYVHGLARVVRLRSPARARRQGLHVGRGVRRPLRPDEHDEGLGVDVLPGPEPWLVHSAAMEDVPDGFECTDDSECVASGSGDTGASQRGSDDHQLVAAGRWLAARANSSAASQSPRAAGTTTARTPSPPASTSTVTPSTRSSSRPSQHQRSGDAMPIVAVIGLGKVGTDSMCLLPLAALAAHSCTDPPRGP